MFKLNELLDNAQAKVRRRCYFEEFFVHIGRFSEKDSYLCRTIPTSGLPLADQLQKANRLKTSKNNGK